MIYTGYYNKLEYYKQNGLTPISIAGGAPDFFDGIEWRFFAPSLDIFSQWKSGKITDEQYIARFVPERLEKLDKSKIRELLLSVKNPILLCYEKPGDFCHRHIVADWISSNLLLECEEYKCE